MRIKMRQNFFWPFKRETPYPTCIVYVDVTLTRSKVKVTDLWSSKKTPCWQRLQSCDCDCR